jgi:protein phosphatase
VSVSAGPFNDPDRPYASDGPIAHGEAIRDRTPPPYDIVGDVHGCIDELRALLEQLGYALDGAAVRHPRGRTLVFIGDLSDRGPGSIAVWQLALASLAAGTALYVPGNHDSKLARYLVGRDVQLTHGLRETLDEFYALPDTVRRRVGRGIARLLRETPPYRILDRGRLVVAHAGVEARLIGTLGREVSVFARFGDPTGEHTPEGFPIRRDWAATYQGQALIVYGHTPTPRPIFRNNTINIDQGCAFGGQLTALRYPERELLSVPALRVYAQPAMAARTSSAQAAERRG